MYFCVKHKNTVHYAKRLIDAQYFHAENFTRKDKATLFSVETDEELNSLKEKYTLKVIQ